MTDMIGVNSQILDAVAQTNVKLVGEAPAEGIGLTLQGISHATILAMENATQVQGGMQQIANAAVAALITRIATAGDPPPAKPAPTPPPAPGR